MVEFEAAAEADCPSIPNGPISETGASIFKMAGADGVSRDRPLGAELLEWAGGSIGIELQSAASSPRNTGRV